MIITPPQNMTKVDGEKVTFPCEWRANPANATVVWYRDGIPIRQISSLESRIETPSEGSLIISPVHMDDSGISVVIYQVASSVNFPIYCRFLRVSCI